MSWDSSQTGNAQAIVDVARARGLGYQGALIGVMTAITESTLVNVNHGDGPGPSSRGLFQQMPGWGSMACRMDPSCAAGLFFDAMIGQPWQTQNVWITAQRVQQSEFQQGFTGAGSDGTEGWNYLQNLPYAQDLVPTLMGTPPAPPIGDLDMTPAQEAKLDRVLVLLGDGTDRPVNENLSILVRNTYASDVIAGSAPTLAGAIGRRLNEILGKIK